MLVNNIIICTFAAEKSGGQLWKSPLKVNNGALKLPLRKRKAEALGIKSTRIKTNNMVQKRSEIEYSLSKEKKEKLAKTEAEKVKETVDNHRSEIEWISEMLSDYEDLHFQAL